MGIGLCIDFVQLEQRDIDFFRSVLPANNVIHDAESDPAKSTMTPYNADFFNLHRGASSYV